MAPVYSTGWLNTPMPENSIRRTSEMAPVLEQWLRPSVPYEEAKSCDSEPFSYLLFG
jgi:hypothetical protein